MCQDFSYFSVRFASFCISQISHQLKLDNWICDIFDHNLGMKTELKKKIKKIVQKNSNSTKISMVFYVKSLT